MEVKGQCGVSSSIVLPYFILFFVTGSLIESGAPTLARLAGEGVPGIHLYLGPQH